jgi:hypothetical protein
MIGAISRGPRLLAGAAILLTASPLGCLPAALAQKPPRALKISFASESAANAGNIAAALTTDNRDG